MTSLPPDEPELTNTDERWQFLRDVLVFNFKMFLDNLRDFLLMPASLVAAALDLVFKGEREGERFYKVLEWGKHSEEIINVYGELDARQGQGSGEPKRDYSVDAVIAKLEGVIVREHEKGGTAANIKASVDRAIDQLQREAGKHKDKATDAVLRAAEKVRSRMERETAATATPPPEPPPSPPPAPPPQNGPAT
ncbi:MAG: hypothetical protein HY243_11650 [Proteobacteria bacterium]|nr:hypothetical protein [Pseudomonadota bacterium]